MQQIVVAYDISDNKRRNRIAKCLSGYGIRVNFSVFECSLKSKAVSKMKAELKDIIKDDKDSIRIYQLCKDCAEKTETCGCGLPGFAEGGLMYV